MWGRQPPRLTNRPVGSFTWYPGESYKQLAHLTDWSTRVLHAAGMEQEEHDYARYESRPLSWGYEHLMSLRKGLSAIREGKGKVILMDRFVPIDQMKEETDERLVACFHCTI